MFSYRTLLKQALRAVWEHKHLWFFGLFASILSAGGGYRLLTRNLSASWGGDGWAGMTGFLNFNYYLHAFWSSFKSLFTGDIWLGLNGLTGLIAILAVLSFFIWLVIASQGGLIHHLNRIFKNKKSSSPELEIKEGLTIGHQKFWPILGLNIIFKVLINFAFFLITIPLLLLVLQDQLFLGVAYVILFIIFIPVAISLSLLIKYALAYNVIEHNSFIVSIENAWKLLKKYWLISAEMLVALFLINFLIGVAVLIILSILVVPLLLVGVIFYIPWLAILMLIIGIIVIIIIGSALTAFQTAGWVNLFLQLAERGGTAKLERLAKGTKKK